MCLRGVERRHEVENNGVAMRINENGSGRKNVRGVLRLGKMWGRLEKCERNVAFSDRLYKRGALKRTFKAVENNRQLVGTILVLCQEKP